MWSTLEGLLASNIASQTSSNELPKYLVDGISTLHLPSPKNRWNWEKKTRGPPNFKLGWISPPTHVNLTQQKKATVTLAEKRGHHGFPSASRHEKYRGWCRLGRVNQDENFGNMCYIWIFDRQEPMLVINICIPSCFVFLHICILYWA